MHMYGNLFRNHLLKIILDDDLTDEQLGAIVRIMYRAKARAQNEQITKTKENAGL